MYNIYRIGEPNDYLLKLPIPTREPIQNLLQPNLNHSISHVDKIQNLISKSGSIFHIMGRAGAGKSYTIRALVEKLSHTKNVAVVAPTGTAALQIGGSTIHSFFRFPIHIINKSHILSQPRNDLIGSLDILIIDECSMVRSDLLDAIDCSLRYHTGDSTPFGGVKIVLVGDPFQLPPVLLLEEKKVLVAAGYRGSNFFTAKIFEDIELDFFELQSAYRHSDPDFIELLDCIRTRRNLTDVLKKINSRVGSPPVNGAALLTLTAHRQTARLINENEMNKLPGKAVTLIGEAHGSFCPNIKYPLRDRLPVPIELRLKSGARVIFVRNDRFHRWTNGTLAVVTVVSPNKLIVRLETGNTGEEHEVGRECWEEFGYEKDPFTNKIQPSLSGIYRQYPILPAWAITVHRSQGATLDRTRCDFGGRAFVPGLAYVGLSRCRSLSEIELVKAIELHDLPRDEAVFAFYRRMQESLSFPWDGSYY